MWLKRSQLEHAIAVLAGEMPSGFMLAERQVPTVPAAITTGLPSALLEQRPDIAGRRPAGGSGECRDRRGGGRAYFPDFSFSLSGGFESALASKLFNAPSQFWSLGPLGVTLPLFDGGQIGGLTDEAKAAYDESVASYRGTVLNAFQEVEDNLVALRQLEQEDVTQNAAAEASGRALAQARYRYTGGIITYLDVVVTQNLAFNPNLSALDVHTRRMVASVGLIKALGGGWQVASLPK